MLTYIKGLGGKKFSKKYKQPKKKKTMKFTLFRYS